MILLDKKTKKNCFFRLIPHQDFILSILLAYKIIQQELMAG